MNADDVASTPWSVGPLQGKYYGTSILDADGREVCSLWLTGGNPSPREDMDPEDVCNDHYETERGWATASLIVRLVNDWAHLGRSSEGGEA